VTLGDAKSVRGSWENARLTAEFCGVSGPIQFKGDGARAPSATYGEVDLVMGTPEYGRLDVPIGAVAAIWVDCNNTGGTGAGDLGSAYIIVAQQRDRLVSLAEITPQAQIGDRSQEVDAVTFHGHFIQVSENWYRSEDADCCPSGRATTIWTYQGGVFRPGIPHITH
jgi:hypothetical protein